MRDGDVYVVVPAFNEGKALSRTVAELEPYGFTVVVVDDGSTIPALEYLRNSGVTYLRHACNLGQGAALQTGTDYALLKGAECIVHFDADGQHSPALIRSLIDQIAKGECDVVFGSRFLNEHDRTQVPAAKRLVLKVGVLVSWLFSGVWLTDAHNGFRALSRAAAQQIRLREDRFAHATEILKLVRQAGLRYREVPVTIRYTAYSKGKGQSAFNGINILIDLFLGKLQA